MADAANNAVKKIAAISGVANSYSISPALPAGLLINPATGIISGTPAAASPATNYLVTATNTGGGSVANINITVSTAPAVASVTITANPGTTICTGTLATLTATAVNGGGSPAYQWQKNGVNVGGNGPVYTDNTVTSGDVADVVLTSNAANVAVPAVTSPR